MAGVLFVAFGARRWGALVHAPPRLPRHPPRRSGRLLLAFTVHDTGIGLPAERLDRLFTAFSQVASSSRNYGGTGLVLCRRLVERMGGGIRVASTAGHGSLFMVTRSGEPPRAATTPACPPPAPARRHPPPRRGSPRHPAPPPHPLRTRGRSCIIAPDALAALGRAASLVPAIGSLFNPAAPAAVFGMSTAERPVGQGFPLAVRPAEDNAVNQKVALRFLQRLGYHADAVAHGLEGLATLDHRTCDLFLMDLQIPEMDGLEAGRPIRARFPVEGQPEILALTAHAMQGDRELCLAAGINDYISKPVKMHQICAPIRRPLGQAGPVPTAPRGIGHPSATTPPPVPRPRFPRSATRPRSHSCPGPAAAGSVRPGSSPRPPSAPPPVGPPSPGRSPATSPPLGAHLRGYPCHERRHPPLDRPLATHRSRPQTLLRVP